VIPILLADIGGTHTRFAFAGSDGRPQCIKIIDNDNFTDLETPIAQYLEQSGTRPHAAVLAVAAPIDGGDEIAMTNRAWHFRRSGLAQRFGLAALRIVNDFEAIAWALPRLTATDARPLGSLAAPAAGVKVALGPGTGLGVAALMPVNRRFVVVPSEGGHASFGPQAEDEFDVFRRLLHAHGSVSAETILSGPGLVRLVRAIDPQTSYAAPEAVVAAALDGQASAAAATTLFVRLLGRLAGGLALTFKAFGGIYIAGGVASRFGPLLDERAFRIAFEAHPPYENILAGVATMLMSRTEPGLLGCCALAEELEASGTLKAATHPGN
jgi:glucokinase